MSRPSFAQLISRAIKRQRRDQILLFVQKASVIEMGEWRPLTFSEQALVLNTLDAFYATVSPVHLGVADIDRVRGALCDVAQSTLTDWIEVRNVAFDALACLSALEARLTLLLDRHESRMVRQRRVLPANDR